MIDFTKLRDLIVEKKCVSSSDYGKEDPFIGIYWKDLIDIINQCDSVKWISVEEALPPYDDRLKTISIDVIVRNEYGKVTSAWYDYANKVWHLLYGEIAGDDVLDSKITHWAPIPSLEGGEG